MRVAWDLSDVEPMQTGMRSYANGLIAALRTRGVDVVELRGYTRARMGTVASIAWKQFGMSIAASRRSVDIIHMPTFVGPVKPTLPMVITVHDLAYLQYPEHYSRRWILYMRTLMPFVLRAAAGIVVVSECTRNELLQAYRVDPQHVHVVHNGVDLARFSPGVPPFGFIERLGLSPGFVLFVGALVARKNVPVLLHAMSLLRKRGHRELRLVIAGAASRGMPGADEIAALIRDLELHEAVVMLGHVDDADLPWLYQTARVLVLPSKHEGFGLPLLEAMASGTPVIAGRNSAMVEIVGDAGLLIDSGDAEDLSAAIAGIASDDSTYEELRRRGLRRASMFTWSAAAARLEGVYTAVSR